MTALWPSSLPDIVSAEGYSEAPRMTNVAFESDSGPPIERPKGTVSLVDISARMLMTDEQVETFEGFIFNDLGQATGDFLFTHPRRKMQVRGRVKGRPPYQINPAGYCLWLISFEITVIG